MKVLSARFDAILQLLSPCRVLADVGTDHGLLPIAAILRGVASHAVAADLREAPLVSARSNIAAAGLRERVTVVQADGLAPLHGHGVDAVVMAGMSAALMARMCDGAPEVLASVQQLVVQPNMGVPLMRRWAREHGLHLRDERMVYERGRFFTVCAFVKASGEDPAYTLPGWTEAALFEVGPRFLARKDPVARRWCEEQRARFQQFVSKGVHKHGPELEAWQHVCDAFR